MTYTFQLNNVTSASKGTGTMTWAVTNTTDSISASVATGDGSGANTWAYNLFNTEGTLPDNLGYEASVTIHQCDTYRNAGIVFDYEDTNNYQVAFLRYGQSQWAFETMDGRHSDPRRNTSYNQLSGR